MRKHNTHLLEQASHCEHASDTLKCCIKRQLAQVLEQSSCVFVCMCVKVQIKIYSTCWIGRENICRERERKTERYGAWYPTCVLTADLSLQTQRADLGAETHTAHSETATESEKLWHFKEKLTHARTYTHKQAVISWEKIHTMLTCLLCVREGGEQHIGAMLRVQWKSNSIK